MHGIHNLHAPVNEIISLKPIENAKTPASGTGDFYTILEKNIRDNDSAESNALKPKDEHHTEKMEKEEPQEKTAAPSDQDSKTVKNKSKDKNDNTSSQEKDNKSTIANEQKSAKAKEARQKENLEKNKSTDAETDNKVKKRDKDLLINDFDSVIDGLDNLIKEMDKQNARTSSIKQELINLKESLKNTINTDLEQKLKDVISMLKLLKNISNTAEKGTAKERPDTTIQSLLHKLEIIKDKLIRQRNNSHSAISHNTDPAVNTVIIEQFLDAHKHEGADHNKDKQNGDNLWNIHGMKSFLNSKGENTAVKNTFDTPRFKEQLNSLLDRAKVVVKDSKNATFTLKLHPRELGSVNIKLGLEQGILHGKFLVDTPEAKTLLLQNLELIREELTQSGVTVGDFNVDVSSHQGQFENQPDERNLASVQIHSNKEIQLEYSAHADHWHNGSINLVI